MERQDEIPLPVSQQPAIVGISLTDDKIGIFYVSPETCWKIPHGQGGIPEIMEDGKTGFLFTYPDYKGLSIAIINLLRNPELAKKIVRNSKEKVLANFLSTRYIYQLERLYHNLLSKKNLN